MFIVSFPLKMTGNNNVHLPSKYNTTDSRKKYNYCMSIIAWNDILEFTMKQPPSFKNYVEPFTIVQDWLFKVLCFMPDLSATPCEDDTVKKVIRQYEELVRRRWHMLFWCGKRRSGGELCNKITSTLLFYGKSVQLFNLY